MRLLHPMSLLLICVGCGGSDFSVPPDPSSDDTGATSDASGEASTASDTATTDTGTLPIDAGCVTPASDEADVYVDASVATSGKGSAACPVKTIVEGIALPSSGLRKVHIKAGSYAETGALMVRANMQLLGEGGVVTVSGGSATPCTPHVEKCLVSMAGASELEGLTLDASSVGNGVVASGTPKIRRTTVTKAQKDGVWLQNGGELGPAFHADANGYAGVTSRGGGLVVAADPTAPNSFDSNKGKGFWAGSVYVPAGGLVVYGGTLDFRGGTAKGNASSGVSFAWAGAGSTATQKVTDLVAQNNAGGGLDFPAKWGSLVLRNSVVTKNGVFGLWFGYAAGNTLDIGSNAAAGGNTFGGGADKNGRVGIFLCRSGATGSQLANGDKFAACPPSQTLVANCDQYPPSYADVGYVPALGVVGATINPVNAVACTVGP